MSVVAEEETGSRQGLSRSARNSVNVPTYGVDDDAAEITLGIAGIAQLGEQQTEASGFLEVPCSIHGPGISFASSEGIITPGASFYIFTKLRHR